MNYAAHYDKLIFRARTRILDCYRERHHVIPKCMGGSNARDNIVELTGAEHYVAHQLLIKMYPDHPWLSVAAVRMSKQCTGNKAYEWLRQRMANDARLRLTGKKRPSRTAEHRAKLSAALMGNKNSLGKSWSRPMSKELRDAIGKRSKGIKRSPEAIEKGASKMRGRSQSTETRKKIGDAHRGKKRLALSVATREKLSASKKGKPWSAARRYSYERNRENSGVAL